MQTDLLTKPIRLPEHFVHKIYYFFGSNICKKDANLSVIPREPRSSLLGISSIGDTFEACIYVYEYMWFPLNHLFVDVFDGFHTGG